MATVSISIPDAVLPRVRHALCVSAGLEETNANAKEALVIHIKATVRNVESREAQRVALDAVPDPDVEGIAS